MSAKIEKRLRTYWKLEAGNVVLLPLCGWLVLRSFEDRMSLWVIVAAAACAGLLLIGAACWRMELARAQGNSALAARIMRWLAPSERPAQALTLLGVLAAIMEYGTDGGLTPSAIAALAFSILAVLEYLNYYVVQLQHFDHAADFKRLISGKGFRRPHLAKAIARHRAKA